MKTVNIAIIPWGNPQNWRYFEYCVEKETLVCERGFSTLSLVTHGLGYSKILVLVPWTLTRVTPGTGYMELVESTRSFINKYICDKEGKVIVEVFPGVFKGFVGGECVDFRASIGDLRKLLIYKLYFHLKQHIDQEDGIKVLLDTTHGVNYFTIAVREAVGEVLALLALSSAKEIKLEIWNADPALLRSPERDDKDPCKPREEWSDIPRLSYHKVSEETLYPWHLSRFIKYRQSENSKVIRCKDDCDLGEDIGEILEQASLLVTAYRAGLIPILTLLTKRNLVDHCGINLKQRIERILENAIQCWSKRIIISKAGECIEVRTSAELADGFRLLLHAYTILSAIETLARRDIVKLDICYAKTKEVKELADRLLKGSEIVYTLFKTEYSNLTYKTKSLSNSWVLYGDLIKKQGEVVERAKSFESEEDHIAARHLIAHSGFNKDIIELRKLSENEVEIRLKQGLEEKINKVLKNIFMKDFLYKS